MKNNARSTSHCKIYVWLSILTIATAILLCFFFYYIFTDNPIVKLGSVQNYLTMLIAVTGFLAAFSAISIYSIFNTSVDSEKERINEMEETLNNKISTEAQRMKGEFDNKVKIETQSWEQSNVNIRNMKALFDLTSPYGTPFNKRQAIFHFSQTPPKTEDIKAFIRNYFQKLGDTERDKPYYRELENLINAWETL